MVSLSINDKSNILISYIYQVTINLLNCNCFL
jgi:hypothetical protein